MLADSQGYMKGFGAFQIARQYMYIYATYNISYVKVITCPVGSIHSKH